MIQLEMNRAPQAPNWEIIATNPAVLAKEQDVTTFNALHQEEFQSEQRLRSCYWNSGVPYTFSGDFSVAYEMRTSFLLDVEAEQPRTVGSPDLSSNDPNERWYLNDPKIEFTAQVSVSNTDLSIGVGVDDKQYLVKGYDKVISPAYPSITHSGGNQFRVPTTTDNKTGLLFVLNDEEQQVVLNERRHFDALKDLDLTPRLCDARDDIATTILEQYGVTDADFLDKHSIVNAVLMEFEYSSRHVSLSVSDGWLGVTCWDSSFDFDQRQRIQRAHTNNQIDFGFQISQLKEELGMDAVLALPAQSSSESEATKEVALLDDGQPDHQETFYEQFNFLDFKLYSPHLSWSLPIAMSLIAMDTYESHQVTARFYADSTDSIVVTGPGQFQPMDDKKPTVWRLTSDGHVDFVDRDEASYTHKNPDVAAAVEQIKAAEITAAENARRFIAPHAIKAKLGMKSLERARDSQVNTIISGEDDLEP